MENSGNIFSNTSDMGNERNDTGVERMGKKGDGGDVYNNRSNYFFYNLSPLYDSNMATIKIGWALFNLLGWPSFMLVVFAWICRLLQIPTDFQLPERYTDTVAILGIVFIVVKILTAIENWWGKRIANRDRLFMLNEKIKEANRKSKK